MACFTCHLPHAKQDFVISLAKLNADRWTELANRGVRVLTGTDAPVPGHAFGASVHGEMSLFVAAGLTPAQALAAATGSSARLTSAAAHP